MIRIPFTFKTSDKQHIQAYRWQPDKDEHAKGIVQLAHGMAEHILRYDAFSRYLVSHGFVVYGNDHRGHGFSITAPDDRGYFADENGFEAVVDDMSRLTSIAANEHPNVPIYLFGHSMGSFLTRRYVTKYHHKISGAILSGTGGDQGLLGSIGILLAQMEKRRIGARTPSRLMDKLTFGSFNKQIQNPRTNFDFLTRDEAVVDNYVQDEHCGFICTAGFFVDLLNGIKLVHQDDQILHIPTSFPLLIISGDQDPVGNYGKDIHKIYKQFIANECDQVAMKLYEGARHELINEINKDEVYDDILYWLHHHLEGGN